LGRSRGGFSTKIHAIVDYKGRPLHVTLSAGQRHEMTKADELLEHAQGRALLGDSGYDSNRFVNLVRRKKMKVVIGNGPGRKRRRRLDRTLYKRRYRVEVFFHNVKRFRAVATRYDKTSRNYLSMLQVACAMVWLK
jgi:transposase